MASPNLKLETRRKTHSYLFAIGLIAATFASKAWTTGFCGTSLAKTVQGTLAAPRAIDRSTPKRYEFTDSSSPHYWIAAQMDPDRPRTLFFTVKTHDHEYGRSQVLNAKEHFPKILKHFEGGFDAIEGYWTYDLPHNLEQFNQLTGPPQSLELEEAARQTWTGKLAAAAGYTNVTFGQREGRPGEFSLVTVFFTKPE